MKQLLKEIQFEINIHLMQGYLKIRALFDQDPSPHLIIKCDKEVNLVRERISQYPNQTNIKFKEYYVIKQNENLILRSIKEMIQVSDAIKEETAQAKYKYNTKLNFLHLSARNAFPSRLVTTSMLKYI